MLFTISGKHIEMSQALKSYAEEKTGKLPRLYNIINQVEVVIDGRDGGKIAVEIIARGEHKKVFVVKEKGDDIHACIDLAVARLETRLRRQKTRERNKKHLAH